MYPCRCLWHLRVLNIPTWSVSIYKLMSRYYRTSSCSINMCWLVVYLPLWKIWKSVGRMKFPTEWKKKTFMFQTTNQILWFSYGFPCSKPQPAGCFVNTLVTPKVHRPCTIIIQDEPVAKPLGNSFCTPQASWNSDIVAVIDPESPSVSTKTQRTVPNLNVVGWISRCHVPLQDGFNKVAILERKKTPHRWIMFETGSVRTSGSEFCERESSSPKRRSFARLRYSTKKSWCVLWFIFIERMKLYNNFDAQYPLA